MANQTLVDLEAAVAKTVTVVGSAKTLIDGIAERIQAAVNEAIAGGASAEDLVGIQDEIDALHSSADSLAASVEANTPSFA